MDSQVYSFTCSVLKENIKIEGKYSDVFGENIQHALATTLVNIEKHRQDYMDERKIEF